MSFIPLRLAAGVSLLKQSGGSEESASDSRGANFGCEPRR